MKQIYISKYVTHYEYSICNLPDDFNNKKIVIPHGFDVVAANSFKGDSTLVYVDLNNVSTIESCAFENCKELQFAYYGAVVHDSESTEKACFNGIVNIPNNSLVIQTRAFRNCSKLHTVVLPKSDNLTIEKEAFENCESLRTIVIPGANCSISAGAFSGCSENLTFLINSKNTSAISYASEAGFRYVEI